MYIALDIGGTNIRVATTETLTAPTINKEIVLKSTNNFSRDIKLIIGSIYNITANPAAIGIGIAGRVDPDTHLLNGSIALTDWINKPIVEILQSHFQCNVQIENDGVVAATGEALYGNIKNDFLYIAWGTGIGGATVRFYGDSFIVQKADRTKHLAPAEEAFGGKVLEHLFKVHPDNANDKVWNEVFDELHSTIISAAGEFDIDTVVLGGGVTLKQKRRLKNYIKKIDTIKVHLSTFDDQTGLYGAFALIAQKNSD